MDKILPVYKPVSMTSFDVIRAFKRSVHPDFKVGHGGTLDPFADGVLLLLLGKATKKMNELSALPKTYRAKALLGASSDTLDKTGEIVKGRYTKIEREELNKVIEKFHGEIMQKIPDYSATKINGVPRYKLARAGKVMESKSKLVTIYSINILQMDAQSIEFECCVSAGTYIRQLSFDILESLGCDSYLESLTRTAIGDYMLENCVKIEDFTNFETAISR